MSTPMEDTPNPLDSPGPRLLRRRGAALAALSVLGVGALVTGIWGANAWPAGSGSDSEEAATSDVMQERLDGLLDIGFPGALAAMTDPDGSHGNYVTGLGDIEAEAPVPVDGEVRAGSNTKTYTAVVVLQLVEEGLIELDEPIENYLPGLVHGEDVDASQITVRHLLQHTSGLPEYTSDYALDIEQIRDAYISPRDLLDAALDHPAHFAPGERWEYSNTNYLLLGLLVERVTERPFFEEVTNRIIEPLDLQHTYFPAAGEMTLRGAHPQGYHQDAEGVLTDVTELDPSWAWAAGQVVTSPSELNEFMVAVLDGRLLGEEMRAEMQKTVPSEEDPWPGAEYGLGIQSYPLSCGGVIWGHGGDIHGFQTRNGAAADGAAFSVAVTALPWGFLDLDDEATVIAAYEAVTDLVDAAFCGD